LSILTEQATQGEAMLSTALRSSAALVLSADTDRIFSGDRDVIAAGLAATTPLPPIAAGEAAR
jgi:hypothetical protein